MRGFLLSRDLLDERALNQQNCLDAFNRVASNLPQSPPPGLSGRGVVICGGGMKYLPSAWVCVNMLRHFGCNLPIELWHLGASEMPDEVASLLNGLGVRCVDAERVREIYPARILRGWELKPYAMLHSRFAQVLLLDADNVCVRDPTHLFEIEEYQKTGALFWPDYGCMQRGHAIWKLTGISPQSQREFESGQMVVDKRRCWREMLLTMWINENSDFWYRYIHGDKETFHLAWLKLRRSYSMAGRGILTLNGTMCQHDFEGKRLFQHRNYLKWSLVRNPHVPGFVFETECNNYLLKLKPLDRVIAHCPPLDADLAKPIAGRAATYHRVKHDQRPMSFDPDGRIGQGTARLERFWNIRLEGDSAVLEIFGENGITARLVEHPQGSGLWQGRWLKHERMEVHIHFEQ